MSSITGPNRGDCLFSWGRTCILQEISLARKADFACRTKRLSRNCCAAALNVFKALAFLFQEMRMLEGAVFTSAAYQKSVAMAPFDWHPTCPRHGLSKTRAYICSFPELVPQTQTRVPSWVPDWSRPSEDSLQGTGIDHMTLVPEYKASGSLFPKSLLFKNLEATTSVTISGFIYDKLREAGAIWAAFEPLENPIPHPFVVAKKRLVELIRLIILRGEVYSTLKKHICGTARTATAEIGYDETGNGNKRYNTAAFLLTNQVNDSPDERLLSSELLALIMSNEAPTTCNLVDTTKYYGEIEAKASGRKPFVTKKVYLGLRLDHVEPGDVVAVLIGSQVPFVLRKSVGGRYKIVGEAYVDGIMDGEAVVRREIVGVLTQRSRK
ncbi:heterokaryon incompatibility protein [Rutstroemia sp. NJR-2017a BVV2]|nr:heterokaryon incompatibility protein [Rutstroemia sp. NJR-2017a BVV2]